MLDLVRPHHQRLDRIRGIRKRLVGAAASHADGLVRDRLRPDPDPRVRTDRTTSRRRDCHSAPPVPPVCFNVNGKGSSAK